ncbi:hypothetical protein HYH03_014787 [Edaphochlamys debaryana]|uniref:Uncharacterized protein n=1 Tax=Edaphochlamys debaryana TaxID=47281 RepID=A0A835XLX2_9CHLO|nr:hypothetical protein HYH03_014787 [Edaphochlamys debaryana]|eukprot:KAG2486483.1 hypothetical protein HYH03_014787 [Edaphochlamys debaryana]
MAPQLRPRGALAVCLIALLASQHVLAAAGTEGKVKPKSKAKSDSAEDDGIKVEFQSNIPFDSPFVKGIFIFISSITGGPIIKAIVNAGLDNVKARRVERGDKKGAARVETLRGWTHFMGFFRGLPQLFMDLFKNAGVALDIAQDWGNMLNQLLQKELKKSKTGAINGTLAELVVTNRKHVMAWAHRSVEKASKAFKGGAVSRLLSDLHNEVTADPGFFADFTEGLSAEAAPVRVMNDGPPAGVPPSKAVGKLPGVPQQLAALLQDVLEVFRDALLPGTKPLKIPVPEEPVRIPVPDEPVRIPVPEEAEEGAAGGEDRTEL